MVKKIIKIILIIIILAALLLVGLFVSFKLERRSDFKKQEALVSQLKGANGTSFSIPDIMVDDSLGINEIRYLSSHNSYYHQAGAFQRLLIDIVRPGEASKLMFSHQSFSRQLDIGIRGFELDIRSSGKKFVNCHVPLIDNRTHSPSVKLALEEMTFWSDRHPEHIPIILLVSPRDDWGFLDPLQKRWSAKSVKKLDTFFKEQLGNRLFTPAERTPGGWPELGALRGRFIVVYQGREQSYFTEDYSAEEDRAAFIMTDPDSSEAAFVLQSDPYSEDIHELISAGAMVLTRADENCIKDAARKAAALLSGAQIISTDFPAGYSSNSDYSIGWFELYR